MTHLKQSCFILLLSFLFSCSSGEKNTQLAIGTSLLTAGTKLPSAEVYQVYYLGVYDPINQIPPTFYRITVRGQASFFSDMKFASGWLPAEAVDSLTQGVTFKQETQSPYAEASNGGEKTTSVRRKFVLMGPEGVRENPDEHRLAIIMGASPKNFLAAVDSAMGEVLQVNKMEKDTEFRKKLTTTLIQLAKNRNELSKLCSGDINQLCQ